MNWFNKYAVCLIMSANIKRKMPRQKNLWVHSGNGRFPSL